MIWPLASAYLLAARSRSLPAHLVYVAAYRYYWTGGDKVRRGHFSILLLPLILRRRPNAGKYRSPNRGLSHSRAKDAHKHHSFQRAQQIPNKSKNGSRHSFSIQYVQLRRVLVVKRTSNWHEVFEPIVSMRFYSG
jgi:hypothetical protein